MCNCGWRAGDDTDHEAWCDYWCDHSCGCADRPCVHDWNPDDQYEEDPMYDHDFDHSDQDGPQEPSDGPGSAIAAAIVLGIILVALVALALFR